MFQPGCVAVKAPAVSDGLSQLTYLMVPRLAGSSLNLNLSWNKSCDTHSIALSR